MLVLEPGLDTNGWVFCWDVWLLFLELNLATTELSLCWGQAMDSICSQKPVLQLINLKNFLIGGIKWGIKLITKTNTSGKYSYILTHLVNKLLTVGRSQLFNSSRLLSTRLLLKPHWMREPEIPPIWLSPTMSFEKKERGARAREKQLRFVRWHLRPLYGVCHVTSVQFALINTEVGLKCENKSLPHCLTKCYDTVVTDSF